jgi:hypothetical protein
MCIGRVVPLRCRPAGTGSAASAAAEKAGDDTSGEACRTGASGRGRVSETGGIFAKSSGGAEEYYGGRLLLQDQEKLSRGRAAVPAGDEVGSGVVGSVSEAGRIGREAERSRGGAGGLRKVSGVGSGGEERGWYPEEGREVAGDREEVNPRNWTKCAPSIITRSQREKGKNTRPDPPRRNS